MPKCHTDFVVHIDHVHGLQASIGSPEKPNKMPHRRINWATVLTLVILSPFIALGMLVVLPIVVLTLPFMVVLWPLHLLLKQASKPTARQYNTDGWPAEWVIEAKSHGTLLQPSSARTAVTDDLSFSAWYATKAFSKWPPLVQAACWVCGGFFAYPFNWMLWRQQKAGKISEDTVSWIMIGLGVAAMLHMAHTHKRRVMQQQADMNAEAIMKAFKEN